MTLMDSIAFFWSQILIEILIDHIVPGEMLFSTEKVEIFILFLHEKYVVGTH